MKRKMQHVLSVITFVLFMFLAFGSDDTESNSGQSSSTEKWYVGGTLHQETISTWKSSSYKNKLATCGDFMATVDNSVSMEELKERAVQLVVCIDGATDGLEETNSMKVSEIASSCIILMGY